MSHGTEHHLEEAEHAQHAKYHPLDKRIAMTMAIIAACLACVTAASHRAHNETMLRRLEENDKWSYQNIKKSRYHQYEVGTEMLEFLVPAVGASEAQERRDRLKAKWEEQKKKEQKQADKAEDEAKVLQAEARHAHHQSNFYDIAELGLEFGLVLCSLAVLTRQRWFWFSGVGVSILGAVVAIYGLTYSFHSPHGEGDGHPTKPATSDPHEHAAVSSLQ